MRYNLVIIVYQTLRRVIRKMDLRIPTLVAALCMSSFKP
jgi:hypothetical protein